MNAISWQIDISINTEEFYVIFIDFRKHLWSLLGLSVKTYPEEYDIYPTPPHEQNATKVNLLKQCLTSLNSAFSFS